MLEKFHQQEELFKHYYNLMSIEYRKEIIGYEDFEMPNTLCSIKVNFKNDSWVRIYQKMNGNVEWY